ncbi:hypothetical protein EVAR_18479_1 [Eumeta japonica]|uniref:Uncharacterized protein n=1 Tax=Eumeta variegata TaxID=151549 RepID=A0A4C1V0C0_EUMVA|nr:hypothetical protein EVAR_18479_1 [Eumeta japonica]
MLGFFRTENIPYVLYKVRNSAAVKLATKASQWRKIGTRKGRKKGRGALYLRIASFTGNSERESFVRCTVRFEWQPAHLEKSHGENLMTSNETQDLHTFCACNHTQVRQCPFGIASCAADVFY